MKKGEYIKFYEARQRFVGDTVLMVKPDLLDKDGDPVYQVFYKKDLKTAIDSGWKKSNMTIPPEEAVKPNTVGGMRVSSEEEKELEEFRLWKAKQAEAAKKKAAAEAKKQADIAAKQAEAAKKKAAAPKK